MTVDAELRRLCNERQWSQSRLARRLAVDPSDVNRWMNGVRPLRLATLARIAVALDLSPDEVARIVSAAYPGGDQS